MADFTWLDHPFLRQTFWSGRTYSDKPAVHLDQEYFTGKELPSRLTGTAAYVVGTNESNFAKVIDRLDAEYLMFYECRVADLSPLARLPRLRHLMINWNTKVTTLDAIGSLAGLRTLRLIDVPKPTDLTPLSQLTELRALEYSGGIWNKARAATLEPLAGLERLEEVRLLNIQVTANGLKPLAKCPALARLDVSNQFETEDYAYLSVARPDLECDKFVPWTASGGFGGWDRMITGKRKPFLNSISDADRVRSYEIAWEKLREKYRKELPG